MTRARSQERDAARESGQREYVGPVCRAGHAARYVSNGACIECTKARVYRIRKGNV